MLEDRKSDKRVRHIMSSKHLGTIRHGVYMMEMTAEEIGSHLWVGHVIERLRSSLRIS